MDFTNKNVIITGVPAVSAKRLQQALLPAADMRLS